MFDISSVHLSDILSKFRQLWTLVAGIGGLIYNEDIRGNIVSNKDEPPDNLPEVFMSEKPRVALNLVRSL
jgi:hypothetical protein